MFVALTQVDFMTIRIVADLVVNSHTTYYFLRNKDVGTRFSIGLQMQPGKSSRTTGWKNAFPHV